MPSHTRISYEYTRTHTHTLSVGAADRHQDSRSWILVAECWMLASDSAASYYNSSLIFNFQCISLFAAAAFPALPPLSTEFISMNWGMAQLAARLATGNKFPHCKLTRMHKFIYFSSQKKDGKINQNEGRLAKKFKWFAALKTRDWDCLNCPDADADAVYNALKLELFMRATGWHGRKMGSASIEQGFSLPHKTKKIQLHLWLYPPFYSQSQGVLLQLLDWALIVNCFEFEKILFFRLFWIFF